MYHYRPLTGITSIRVLHLEPGTVASDISCRLSHIDIGEEPDYEALSYVWGTPALTYSMLCEGKQLAINESLHSALQRFRFEDRSRVLWADGICIDQKIVEERNQQVRIMRDVYQQAR